MKRLIRRLDWTAEEAELVADFLGGLAAAIWSEYADELRQLFAARTEDTTGRYNPSEDDSDLF